MSELQKSSLTLPPSNCFSLPTGELSWKIMNYRSAKNQAISHNSKIRSDIFATDQGYKFCLEVLLNGYSDNYKGYVSMVLKLLPGENDNALCWPFTGHVTISLMALGQPLFEKCVPVDMNQSIGKKRSIVCIPQFVTINKLETDCKCLANDFLEIKVSVKQN